MSRKNSKERRSSHIRNTPTTQSKHSAVRGASRKEDIQIFGNNQITNKSKLMPNKSG